MHFKMYRVVEPWAACLLWRDPQQVAPLGHFEVLGDFGARFLYSSRKEQRSGLTHALRAMREEMGLGYPPPRDVCWVLCGQEL